MKVWRETVPFQSSDNETGAVCFWNSEMKTKESVADQRNDPLTSAKCQVDSAHAHYTNVRRYSREIELRNKNAGIHT
jgi:hypothetical protein